MGARDRLRQLDDHVIPTAFVPDQRQDLPSQVRRAMRAIKAPPCPWPLAPRLADHRLVFLAAKPAMLVLSQSRWGAFVHFLERGAPNATPSSVRRGVRPARRIAPEARNETMKALVVACEDLRGRLTDEELQAIRHHGQLPTWFVPALHEEAKKIKSLWR